MSVGKSEKRVDAFDKVTGRAKYTEDLVDPRAYVAKNFTFNNTTWKSSINRYF